MLKRGKTSWVFGDVSIVGDESGLGEEIWNEIRGEGREEKFSHDVGDGQ